VGVRDLLTLKEEDHKLCAKDHNWEYLETKDFNQISKERQQEKCFEVLLKLGGNSTIEAEGYIVSTGDEKWHRIVVKGQNYSMLENLPLTYALSTRIRVLCCIYCEILRDRKEEVFCALFPVWAKWCVFMAERVLQFCKDIEDTYEPLKDLPIKEFSNALNPQSDPFKFKYVFLYYHNNYLKNIRTD